MKEERKTVVDLDLSKPGELLDEPPKVEVKVEPKTKTVIFKSKKVNDHLLVLTKKNSVRHKYFNIKGLVRTLNDMTSSHKEVYILEKNDIRCSTKGCLFLCKIEEVNWRSHFILYEN